MTSWGSWNIWVRGVLLFRRPSVLIWLLRPAKLHFCFALWLQEMLLFAVDQHLLDIMPILDLERLTRGYGVSQGSSGYMIFVPL